MFIYTPTAAARHAAAKVGAGPSVTTDTVAVTVTDAKGAATGTVVAVPVSPKNAAPVPKVTVGTPNASTGVVTGSVTATDADGDVRTYTVTATTAKGSVNVNPATGAFTYTPTATARHDASATTASPADKTDSFTVTVSDGFGAVVPVAVTVSVGPKNTAPTATSAVQKPDPVTGMARGLVNAVDLDNDPFAYTASKPANGTVTVNADGSFTYTPTAAARAAARVATSAKTETFVVTVADGHGGTRAVTVTAVIAPSDSAPVVGTPTVGGADPVLGVVIGTVPAADPDADPLTFAVTKGATNGSVNVTAAGQFTYTPTLLARRSAAAADTFEVTVTDKYGAATVAGVTVPISPSAVVPTAEDYVLIRKTQLLKLPTSGVGWDYLKQQADNAWGATNLSNLNTTVQTSVLAAALVYARTGDTAYRDKVVAAIRNVPGTEAGTTVLLPFARNLFGYVAAADLVDMPLETVCDNGQTWRGFLEAARTEKFSGNTRWINLEVTSGDSAGNWNAYALSSHLAVSIVLGDDAAVQRDIDIYRRFLGDVTSPWPAFNPTSGYLWNGNGRTWDMMPTLQRGINPYRPGDARSGAIIVDASRHTTLPSTPCCQVDAAGRAYIEESLDGLLAINMVLRAQGADFTEFEQQALRRAYEFLIRNGGPSGYSNGRFLALAVNSWYGMSFSTTAGDSVARQLGFGGWLFTR